MASLSEYPQYNIFLPEYQKKEQILTWFACFECVDFFGMFSVKNLAMVEEIWYDDKVSSCGRDICVCCAVPA